MDMFEEHEKKRFLDLADRLARSVDGKEQQRLKAELALLTFGDRGGVSPGGTQA